MDSTAAHDLLRRVIRHAIGGAVALTPDEIRATPKLLLYVETQAQEIDRLRTEIGAAVLAEREMCALATERLHGRGCRAALDIRGRLHPSPCGKGLECGGACVLAPNHPPPCSCGGDDPGEPGTCPA